MSADLACDISATSDHRGLLESWFRVMSGSGALPTPEEIGKMREAYTRDVAVLPLCEIRDIIMLGGFDCSVLFFQAGMIHAWSSRRSTSQAE